MSARPVISIPKVHDTCELRSRANNPHIHRGRLPLIFHHTTAVVDTIDREEDSNHSPSVLDTGAKVGGELGLAWSRHSGRPLGESWEFFGCRFQVRLNPRKLRIKGRPVRIRAIERLWEKGWIRQVGSTDLRQQSGRHELQGHRRDAEQERRQSYPDRFIVPICSQPVQE